MARMQMGSRLLPLAMVLGVAACAGDSPTAAPVEESVSHLQQYACTATVATGEISCVDPSGRRDVIFGTQNGDVKVTSSNVNYDQLTQLFTFDVTVKNLKNRALGTTDGTTLHPQGVRLFFGSGPTVTGGIGVVLPLNPDGTNLFLLGLSPFYQWNEVIQPNQTSTVKGWVFLLPVTVTSFTFNLYVSTELGPVVL